MLESELFGYEKGAFTGAVSTKPGRFELANRGIIFLDEIGDLHPSLQAKLLQVIEHKEFTKLGGRRQIHVDVQIIAATNADLEEKTRDGSFRPDLYFRLNEVCIWVPSLAARKEDVPQLVRHFLQKHGILGWFALSPRTSPPSRTTPGLATSANSKAPSNAGSPSASPLSATVPGPLGQKPNGSQPNHQLRHTPQFQKKLTAIKSVTPSNATNGTAAKPPTISE